MFELAEQNKKLNELINKGEDINSSDMFQQITNHIIKQDELNDLLKDEKRTYDDALNEYKHLQDVEQKAKIETIDLQLDNKRTAAKVEAIKKSQK